MDSALSWIDIFTKTIVKLLTLKTLQNCHSPWIAFHFHWSSPALPPGQQWHDVTRLAYLCSLSTWPRRGSESSRIWSETSWRFWNCWLINCLGVLTLLSSTGGVSLWPFNKFPSIVIFYKAWKFVFWLAYLPFGVCVAFPKMFLALLPNNMHQFGGTGQIIHSYGGKKLKF